MKFVVSSIAATSLLATLALAEPPRYAVTDLGPVGALPGQPFSIRNNGLVAGAVITPHGRMHAVLWDRTAKMRDIGVPGLGGPNSIAFAVNEKRQAVGEAEISASGPNAEDFCGFKALGLQSAGSNCRPFVWQHGGMTPLPTLGGRNGNALTVNNSGEAAGTAQNTTPDPTCPAPLVHQFKPVYWDRNGKVHELPTFAGDQNGIAFSMNDNGQVVGSSGDCAAFDPMGLNHLSARHALLWEESTVTNLGNLGGVGGSGSESINNRGQVVGYSAVSNDGAFHAFLWTRQGGMKDLGTLPGDKYSVGISINDRGQVVGVSADASFQPRPFLRNGSVMTDLNQLVPAGSPLLLLTACSINSRGEITGFAVQKSNGEIHSYLAAPR